MRTLLILLLALPVSGCGLLFQAVKGYDQEEKRVEKVAHALEIDSLPTAAELTKVTRERKEEEVAWTPAIVELPYEQEVTITSPAGMAPYWIGTAIDGALTIALGVLLRLYVTPELNNRLERATLWSYYSMIPAFVIGEVVAGGIVGGREPKVSLRKDRPTSHNFVLRTKPRGEVHLRVEAPTVGPTLSVPFDQDVIPRLNRQGVTMIMTQTASAAR